MGKTSLLMGSLAYVAAGLSVQAAELGTHFTYQGRLVKNGATVGSPTPVICDMTFGLFDALSGGNAIGLTPLGPLSISVDEGLFHVNLSFGPGAINGQARWLEITVDCPGDAMPTVLTPRLPLRPTPHALALPGLYTLQDAFSPNLIGGKHENAVAAGVSGATIAGGGAAAPDNNRVTDTFGTVGGGCSNRAGNNTGTPNDAEFATVAGGFNNIAGGSHSAIGGGNGNSASGNRCTVGGGAGNAASAEYAFVSGGLTNTASGSFSSVGGGRSNTAGGTDAVVDGGSSNTANGVRGTIGGGYSNLAGGDYSTVGGGENNEAAQLRSFVGGGLNNIANGSVSAIVGGSDNVTTGFKAMIGGGGFNTAGGSNSVIGGGDLNTSNGAYSTVPGGAQNAAGGDYSFAGGRRAKVRDAAASGDANGDEGTFVWSDANLANFTSTGPNQFLVRASGGARIYSDSGATVGVQLAAGGNSWSMLSDRNAKENFKPIDARDVLRRVAALPVTLWNLKSQNSDIQHLGPMAQDFHTAFGLGESNTHISGGDVDGVALAAIQGLHQIVQEKDCEIEELRDEVSALRALVTTLVEKVEGGSR